MKLPTYVIAGPGWAGVKLRRHPDSSALDIWRLHLAWGPRTAWQWGIHKIARNVVQIVVREGGPFVCVGWAKRAAA